MGSEGREAVKLRGLVQPRTMRGAILYYDLPRGEGGEGGALALCGRPDPSERILLYADPGMLDALDSSWSGQ